MNSKIIDDIVNSYVGEKHLFECFMNGVVDTFRLEPSLNKYGNPIIYTIKNRLKDEDHLKDKIKRKWDESNPITPENIFDRITDLAGVRVLHLCQDQFTEIHKLIHKKIVTTQRK